MPRAGVSFRQPSLRQPPKSMMRDSHADMPTLSATMQSLYLGQYGIAYHSQVIDYFGVSSARRQRIAPPATSDIFIHARALPRGRELHYYDKLRAMIQFLT